MLTNSATYDPVTNTEAPKKRELPLFFIIDCSGSMAGTPINQVNTAIRDVMPALRQVGGSAAEVSVAVLTFSNEVEWHTKLTPVEDFGWGAIDADGITSMGAAFDELCTKMSRNEFLISRVGYAKPVLILMSDGQPTDDWESALDKLKQNKWYKLSLKIAVAIGNEADIEPLIKFTGTKESVLIAPNPSQLAKLIQVIAVKSTEIGSKSTNIDLNNGIDRDVMMQNEVNETLSDEIQNDKDLYGVTISDGDWDDEEL